MFDLFKKSSNKKPQKTIAQAVEEAGDRLRDVLKDQSIRVVLIDSENSPVLDDFQKQWGNKSKLLWPGQLCGAFEDDSKYFVALYSGDILCGLCENQVNENYINKDKNFVRSCNVEIFKIEGNPLDDLLKGYLIPAFTQVNLNVAQTLKAQSLSVFRPREGTIPSYLRIGYKQLSGRVNLFKSIKHNTELDWNPVFEYQKSKGRQVPSSP